MRRHQVCRRPRCRRTPVAEIETIQCCDCKKSFNPLSSSIAFAIQIRKPSESTIGNLCQCLLSIAPDLLFSLAPRGDQARKTSWSWSPLLKRVESLWTAISVQSPRNQMLNRRRKVIALIIQPTTMANAAMASYQLRRPIPLVTTTFTENQIPAQSIYQHHQPLARHVHEQSK